eukprot:8755860-Alexandrium_andersonii.AAC.1
MGSRLVPGRVSSGFAGGGSGGGSRHLRCAAAGSPCGGLERMPERQGVSETEWWRSGGGSESVLLGGSRRCSGVPRLVLEPLGKGRR